MVRIDDKVVMFRHFSVQRSHAATHFAHLFHSSHELVLGYGEGLSRLFHAFRLNGELILVENHLHHLFHFLAFLLAQLGWNDFVLRNQLFYGVCIDSDEPCIGKLLLQRLNEMTVEQAVHQKYVITLVLCRLDIRILVLGVLCIKKDQFFILIRLQILDFLLVFVESEIFSRHILQLTNL